MVIISKTKLVEFGISNEKAIEPINKWYEEVKKADWKNFSEMKKTFNPNYSWIFVMKSQNVNRFGKHRHF